MAEGQAVNRKADIIPLVNSIRGVGMVGSGDLQVRDGRLGTGQCLAESTIDFRF